MNTYFNWQCVCGVEHRMLDRVCSACGSQIVLCYAFSQPYSLQTAKLLDDRAKERAANAFHSKPDSCSHENYVDLENTNGIHCLDCDRTILCVCGMEQPVQCPVHPDVPIGGIMAHQKQMLNQALKKDAGKDRWELLPLQLLEGIVKVLTFGAVKYEDDGWQELMKTPEGLRRVVGSFRRHQLAIEKHGLTSLDLNEKGQVDENHSGLPHIDHLGCNWLFLKFRQLLEEEDAA